MTLPGLGYTIPYSFSEIKAFVPCPARVHTMDNILSMFTWCVWLILVLVLVLTGVVFWCSKDIPDIQPTHPNPNLSLSLYNAWAQIMEPKDIFYLLCVLLFCSNHRVSSVLHFLFG
jgi:hypothetical protein